MDVLYDLREQIIFDINEVNELILDYSSSDHEKQKVAAIRLIGKIGDEYKYSESEKRSIRLLAPMEELFYTTQVISYWFVRAKKEDEVVPDELMGLYNPDAKKIDKVFDMALDHYKDEKTEFISRCNFYMGDEWANFGYEFIPTDTQKDEIRRLITDVSSHLDT